MNFGPKRPGAYVLSLRLWPLPRLLPLSHVFRRQRASVDLNCIGPTVRYAQMLV